MISFYVCFKTRIRFSVKDFSTQSTNITDFLDILSFLIFFLSQLTKFIDNNSSKDLNHNHHYDNVKEVIKNKSSVIVFF